MARMAEPEPGPGPPDCPFSALLLFLRPRGKPQWSIWVLPLSSVLSSVNYTNLKGFWSQKVPLRFLRIQPPFIAGEAPEWTCDLDWGQCLLEGELKSFKSEFKNIPKAGILSWMWPNENFNGYKCKFFQNVNCKGMKRRKVGCLLYNFFNIFVCLKIFIIKC